MLIGREKEINTLKSLLETDESELVSVIGRRRVGKTYLVQTVFSTQIDFELTGMQHTSLREQLKHFSVALNLHAKSNLPLQAPKSWLEAFHLLIQYLEHRDKKEKRVIFFDEFPWLSTHRSGFLNAFGFFWNSWAVKNNVVVIICGSAASWMIQKVVHNKGGLYNRVTKRVNLLPFTLYETKLFLQQKRGLNLEHYQIVELYMAMGGIPHYLKEIQKGESTAQNIDRICFDNGGPLYDEFEQLYPSLFDHAENHIAIIRALATKWMGLTRNEILTISKLSNGGGITKTIEELQQSGFVTEYLPWGRKNRESLFRLTDEYSLFYIKYIESMKKEGAGVWQHFQQTQMYRSWSGYAFESICLKHLPHIKHALGISGVFSTASSFYQKGADGMDGCQIDMLIDRNDGVINLCEIKWSASEYILTKLEVATLRKKSSLFKYYGKTNKQISWTLISPFGLMKNDLGNSVIEREITLDHLFAKLP